MRAFLDGNVRWTMGASDILFLSPCVACFGVVVVVIIVVVKSTNVDAGFIIGSSSRGR